METSSNTEHEETKQEVEIKPIECSHYARKKLNFVTPCCDKVYPCRFCHDGEENHSVNWKEITEVVCTLCNTRQPVRAECHQCGTTFGNHTCLKCNIFDDDTSKRRFHCNGCGICRVGDSDKFFHCETCNFCFPIKLQNNHKCVENISRANCPICLEDLHTSQVYVHVPQCSHLLHNTCYKELLSNGHYKCPSCQTSLVDKSKDWKALDVAIARSAYYYKIRVDIICKDCHVESDTPYHDLGLKCIPCGSYNTCSTSRLNWDNIHLNENNNAAYVEAVDSVNFLMQYMARNPNYSPLSSRRRRTNRLNRNPLPDCVVVYDDDFDNVIGYPVDIFRSITIGNDYDNIHRLFDADRSDRHRNSRERVNGNDDTNRLNRDNGPRDDNINGAIDDNNDAVEGGADDGGILITENAIDYGSIQAPDINNDDANRLDMDNVPLDDNRNDNLDEDNDAVVVEADDGGIPITENDIDHGNIQARDNNNDDANRLDMDNVPLDDNRNDNPDEDNDAVVVEAEDGGIPITENDIDHGNIQARDNNNDDANRLDMDDVPFNDNSNDDLDENNDAVDVEANDGGILY